jgi:two-component system, LuxR family, response regulator FixJ
MSDVDLPLKEICLLDDDEAVLRSMRFLLAAEGFQTRAFNNPEEFLGHAANSKVNVLVTDIWMEQMTGLEVLARLCAISPNTRVIVITGREDLAARATATAIGPVAFLTKPFNDEEFLAAIRTAVT